MASSDPTNSWQPIPQAERYRALDVLRGLALLGVLVVNLDASFRISFAERLLRFHTHSSGLDRLADVLIASLFQFKAISLFSLCFGIGVAVQAERAAPRGIGVSRFLLRRFLVLFALGLCHALLIWDGDILTLYAVCGLLLLPLLRLPAWLLAIAGVAAIALNFVLPLGSLLPTYEFYVAHAQRSTPIYAQGSYAQITELRWQELRQLTAPLIIAALPKTFGLMLLGVAVWRSGLVRQPHKWQVLLWTIVLLGGSVGGTATVLKVYSASTGKAVDVPPAILEAGSYIPLALAYAAGVLLWMSRFPATRWAAPFAAVGQMALTNYLMQSVILGFIFYGYGLGLFGRLGPTSAALIGLALYAVQVIFSLAWLSRYRLGPVEWLWRCLSYGHLFPLRREE